MKATEEARNELKAASIIMGKLLKITPIIKRHGNRLLEEEGYVMSKVESNVLRNDSDGTVRFGLKFNLERRGPGEGENDVTLGNMIRKVFEAPHREENLTSIPIQNTTTSKVQNQTTNVTVPNTGSATKHRPVLPSLTLKPSTPNTTTQTVQSSQGHTKLQSEGNKKTSDDKSSENSCNDEARKNHLLTNKCSNPISRNKHSSQKSQLKPAAPINMATRPVESNPRRSIKPVGKDSNESKKQSRLEKSSFKMPEITQNQEDCIDIDVEMGDEQEEEAAEEQEGVDGEGEEEEKEEECSFKIK